MKIADDPFIKYKVHLERRKRQRIVMSVVPIALGMLLLFGLQYFPYLNNEVFQFYGVYLSPYPTLISLALSCMVAGGGYLLYWYLQTGFKNDYEDTLHDYNYNHEIRSGNFGNYISTENSHELESVHKKLTALEAQLQEVENRLDFSPGAIDELFDQMKEKLTTSVGSEMLNDVRKVYEKELGIDGAEAKLTQAHQKTSIRLEREIETLGRRGSTNLTLGVVTTLIGLFLLTAFIFMKNDFPLGSMEYLINFTPRLSLVVFVEVFAYFFLRLYKAGLSEIKYFQNELTNLESKHIALMAALRSQDSNMMNKVIEAVAATERNQIIEKGQTTVEIQKMQMDKDHFIEVAKTIASIVPKR
ncbi:hypothetical protein [Pseudomonas sp. S2_B10]